MAGINKSIIVGRLGKDPEIRYTESGDAVCNFSVATSEEWKDKTTGEKKEKVEWHKIVVWRKLAEICAEFLSKGKQVYVEGKLQTRSWEKDGVTRYTTEINASDVQFLGSKGDGGDGGQQDRGGHQGQGQGYGPGPDDDIPF